MKKIFTTFIVLIGASLSIYSCNNGEATGPQNTRNIDFIANPSSFGSISATSLDYITGDTITAKATPEPGYVFKSWSGDILSSNSATAKILVDKPKKITANFAPKSYKLTLNIKGNGSVKIVEVDSGSTIKQNIMQQYVHDFPTGTKLQFTATPSVNYKFLRWNGISDSLAEANPLTYTTEGSAHSITAAFQRKGSGAPPALKPQGQGTKNKPYKISSLANLIWLSQKSSRWAQSKYYIQTNDIDATSTSSNSFNSGKGFSPIGISDGKSFNGSYDGQKYVISNLYINRTKAHTGLFGDTGETAIITDIHLTKASITGGNYSGGLVGVNRGKISLSSFGGSYQGGYRSGGIVGGCYGGYIKQSYNTASVTGKNALVSGDANQIGGITGFTQKCDVMDSYNTGDVLGNYQNGGVVGLATKSTIKNTYNAGKVQQVNGKYQSKNGGIASSKGDGAAFSNNYFDSSVTGSTVKSGIGGTGVSTTKMMKKGTFSGFDFSSLWAIDGGSSYPYLQNNTQSPHPGK